MRIEIASYRIIGAVVKENSHHYDVVIIGNSNEKEPETIKQFSKSYLYTVFDDIDCPLEGFKFPDIADIQQIIEYAKGKTNLIVTCPHGWTRSPAVAYVCNCINNSPKEAIKILSFNRHYPNKAVIRHGATLMGDEEIFNVYHRWLIRGLNAYYR